MIDLRGLDRQALFGPRMGIPMAIGRRRLAQANPMCPDMTQDAYNAAAQAQAAEWEGSGKSTLTSVCGTVNGRIKQECHFPNGYASAQDVGVAEGAPPSCDAQWNQQAGNIGMAGQRYRVGQAAASPMKEIGDSQFSEVLAAPKAVAMFYSPGCPYSQKFYPQYQSLAAQYPDVQFYAINVDQHVQNASKYGTRMLPTVVFFTAGKEVNRIDGVQDPSDFTAEMAKAWSGQAPAAAQTTSVAPTPTAAPPRGGTLVESTTVAPGIGGPSPAAMVVGGLVGLGILGALGYAIFGK